MLEAIEQELLRRLPRASIRGSEIVSCCPYHQDRSPSFSVSMEKGVYHCFSCSAGGTLNSLLRFLGSTLKYKRLKTYVDHPADSDSPLYRLDRTVGFPLWWDFYNARGISTSVAQHFNFRFCFDGPYAVLPVYFAGVYRGYLKRNLDPRVPKYLASDGLDVGDVVWGLDDCDPERETWIVEGILDAAVLWTIGIQAVALLGKNYKNKLDYLKQLKKTVVVPDNGDPDSTRVFLEIKKHLSSRLWLVPRAYKDVSDLICGKER